MLKKLSWQAHSNKERNKVIEEIKNSISSCDGYIINFNMFSDLALTLSIEIEENKIKLLHKTLSSVLNVSEFEDQNINHESKKDWLLFLNISFTKGKGELKQKVPEIPG